ncbi:hypothetical protein DES53_11247 [Roseimicrobium gellanilyticum]|uniref:Uncharacterized protein n=2 Tax=Roseimicrobium gellanilyticum TaxID=748857 RepID=A0A366H8E4_9BACT|nr:hypothetical protein DES53_11247 [Roseimicrobium gellanilyticum]
MAGAGAIGGAAISQLPAGERPGLGDRPGAGQLPAHPGIGAGDHPGIGGGERPGQQPVRPENRPNWGDWSNNRGEAWHDRVNNRHESWNNWQQNSQQRRSDFQNNRDQRWDNIENARNDRQDWRNQNREDWQDHRKEMWDYRYDRRDEVWDNCRDWYDDVFDDHWWGHCGWLGHGIYHGFGHYPLNPWWWWRPCTWGTLGGWLYTSPPAPVYPDYGMTVIYEDNTVYVDNKPIPEEQYTGPIVEVASTKEQSPPPVPPAEGKPEEWMPLGVFALVQEEKGTPNMFMQLSINRDGVITGGYQNTITGDERALSGQVDKATQIAAWRIGDNRDTICTTSIANLTQDVCTLALHFKGTRTESWLLVRMPEPVAEGQEKKIPEGTRTPPPQVSAVASTTAPASTSAPVPPVAPAASPAPAPSK